MVAVTYGVSRVPASEPEARAEAGARRKGWFGRFMDSLIATRMEQARREIRMHTHLLPYTVDEGGNRIVKTDTGDMPFGGW